LGMGCVASAAVIIRIPYLHDYKDPDFLCRYSIQISRSSSSGKLHSQVKIREPYTNNTSHSRRDVQHFHLVQRRSQPRHRSRQPRHPSPPIPLVSRPQLRRNSEQAYR
jgi:hypothetical protein